MKHDRINQPLGRKEKKKEGQIVEIVNSKLGFAIFFSPEFAKY